MNASTVTNVVLRQFGRLQSAQKHTALRPVRGTVRLCILLAIAGSVAHAQFIERISVPERLMMKEIVRAPAPVFTTGDPGSQRFVKAGGKYEVRYRAIIAVKGEITDLRLIAGDPWLVKISRPAILEWKFKPSIFDGRPVEVETTLTVHFNFGKPQ